MKDLFQMPYFLLDKPCFMWYNIAIIEKERENYDYSSEKNL